MRKPPDIAADPFKSARWDELTAGRTFKPGEATSLSLLVQWEAVAQKCIDEIDQIGQAAYQDDMGNLKPIPQIASLKVASAEIRALSKALKLDEQETETNDDDESGFLRVIVGNRADKRANRRTGTEA
jgi:hypothetical protein